jgi:hypothetical protein
MKWNKYPEAKPNKAFPHLDMDISGLCLVRMDLPNPLGGTSPLTRLARLKKGTWLDSTADIIYPDVKWFMEIDSLLEPRD